MNNREVWDAVNADGEYVRNIQANYSIMQYCANQFKNSTDAAYLTVISDVLALGAETQIYMKKTQGEDTGDLVTDLVGKTYTLTPSTFVSVPDSSNKQSLEGDKTQPTTWKSANLKLGATTEVNLKFQTDNAEDLVVKIDIGGFVYYYTAEDFTQDKDKPELLVVNLNQITVMQYDDMITATFERNGEQIGNTLTYSVNTYIYRNYEKTNDQTPMIKALYNYGLSVYSFYSENK